MKSETYVTSLAEINKTLQLTAYNKKMFIECKDKMIIICEVNK